MEGACAWCSFPHRPLTDCAALCPHMEPQASGGWTSEELDTFDAVLRKNPHAMLPAGLRREVLAVSEASPALPAAGIVCTEIMSDILKSVVGLDLLLPRMVTRVDRHPAGASDANAHSDSPNSPASTAVRTTKGSTHAIAFGTTVDSTLPQPTASPPPRSMTGAVYRFGDRVVHSFPIPQRPSARFFVNMLGSLADTVSAGDARASLLQR